MIVKITITKASTIVRDNETSMPEGINQYHFVGKLSKAEAFSKLSNLEGRDPIIGTNETMDNVQYEKLELDLSPESIAELAEIKTGILSGPYTTIPFNDTESVKEAE